MLYVEPLADGIDTLPFTLVMCSLIALREVSTLADNSLRLDADVIGDTGTHRLGLRTIG